MKRATPSRTRPRKANTEHKRTEEELRKASLYARSLLEASLDPLVTISREGKITDVNQAAEKVTGVSREQLIGSDFSSYFTDPESARRGYEQVFAQGTVQDYPLAIRSAAGKITDVLYNATVFKNEDGEVVGVFAAARDITERKRVEAEAREAQERFRLLLDGVKDYAIYMLDLEGNVSSWNDGAARIKGYCSKEILGKHFSCFYRAEDIEAGKPARELQESASTGRFEEQAWRVRKDGSAFWANVVITPMYDDSGALRGFCKVARDITERRRAEEEIRRLNDELEQRVIQRTAQLEAANKELEAFTYSVSHDLRAPLRHISGFSKILTEEFGSNLPVEAQHHLQRIQEGTRRMGLLVDDLLNLARVGRRELSLQVAGLKSVVDEVIAELAPECKDRQVEWKIGDLPFVECDPGLMRQVFQNLLSNALKFTRTRTQAVIEVGQTDHEGTPVVFVRDNGVGFSMKYADKLFGVFQRLHRAEDFEGTGVGLAAVQRIIDKHGGRIWAEAELDKGATFYFILGASEAAEVKTKAVSIGQQA